MATNPVGGRKLKFQPACTGIHWKMIAKVDPIVNVVIKTVEAGKQWYDLRKGYDLLTQHANKEWPPSGAVG
jgi:hypothetical protein